jgi:TRAP-type transport system periplasmic protein
VRSFALLVMIAGVAQAEPVILRFATPAPEGTPWAREGYAFRREVETATQGRVKVKYYLGGITGDEMQTWERIKRGQLDGIASGGMLCMKLAPSMRVLRVLGLFQSRDESAYVSGRLRRVFDEEFRKEGFTNMGELGVGPDVIFSRTPMTSMADLAKARLWYWDLDPVMAAELPLLGIPAVPVALENAHAAYDAGKLDGFVAVPAAALAFQWSSQVRYVSDLRIGFLRGCLLIANRALDQLSVQDQQILRSSNAKLAARLEDVGRSQDEALLGGLFAKQGTRSVAVSPAFRAEFFEAARVAREKLGETLVPKALLQKVLSMLADYRAEHRM